MQYIVKPGASSQSGFAWHRDSDWCSDKDHQYSPYISLWCALDETTEGDAYAALVLLMNMACIDGPCSLTQAACESLCCVCGYNKDGVSAFPLPLLHD